MLDPVLSPSTELAGFGMVIVFTTPRHFVRLHASEMETGRVNRHRSGRPAGRVARRVAGRVEILRPAGQAG